jgi:hypothetical protein
LIDIRYAEPKHPRLLNSSLPSLLTMEQPVDPKEAVRQVLGALGDVRKLARSFAMLWMLLVGFFLPIPTAYELWRVGDVTTWREVPVRLDAVEEKRPTFGKGPWMWRYTFTDLETARRYETGDIEPGDFPVTVLGWSTTDAAAHAYLAEVGHTIRVRRSPDRQSYFLRAGDRSTMTVVLTGCALYWMWLVTFWLRRKRS